MPAPGNIVTALLTAESEPELSTPPSDVPWPSEFEVELRQRFAALEARQAALESHQLRTDRLVMDVQLQMSRLGKAGTQLALRVESKVDELVKAVRALAGNGHG